MEPVLIYDGDCGFCTTSVKLIERIVRPDARSVPFQRADLPSLGIAPERAEYEVLYIDRRGRIHGGAQAFGRLLVDSGLPWSPPGWIIRMPPIRWLAHWLYRLIAKYRHKLPGGTPACALPR